jgi:transposase IS66 family protein
MIALLKYGSGFPFHRLEGLQENMEIPLPASTQWEIVSETAEKIELIYQERIHQAAQGEVLHNDDTTMKILNLMGKSRARPPSADAEAEEKSERTGIFTSGIVSTRAGQKIALFFTGRKHAGENLASVLAHRAQALGPAIQMCDALSRNLPQSFKAWSPTVSRTADASLSRWRPSFPRTACMCWKPWARCTGTMPSAGSRGCRRSNVSPITKARAVRSCKHWRNGSANNLPSAKSSPTPGWAKPSLTCRIIGPS